MAECFLSVQLENRLLKQMQSRINYLLGSNYIIVTFWALSIESRPLMGVRRSAATCRELLSTCASHSISTPSPVPLQPHRKPIKVLWSAETAGGTCTQRVDVYCITWCAGGYWHGNCVDSSQALVPTGNCHSPPHPPPPLSFLCGSCRVIGWLLRTWWTQPNIQGDGARPACVPAPPGTPDTYLGVCQGRGLIRRGKETREEEASEMGGVEGASDEWREWVAPGGLKQLKQTGPRLTSCFCLLKSSLW